MTVIAWKGRTLAGDKQTNDAGMKVRTTKVDRIQIAGGAGEVVLFGGSGDAHRLRELREWVRDGMKPADYPPWQRDESKCVGFIVVSQRGAFLYAHGTNPLPLQENGFFALGSGRDFAMAAMHCGKSPGQAVEVANLFQADCGMGYDEVTLE